MIGPEALADGKRTVGIDPETFWARLDPMLAEHDITPLEHMRSIVNRCDAEINAMPNHVFDDERSSLYSPLRETHSVLSAIVNQKREQPFTGFTIATAKELFPYWLEQLKDVQEEIGAL